MVQVGWEWVVDAKTGLPGVFRSGIVTDFVRCYTFLSLSLTSKAPPPFGNESSRDGEGTTTECLFLVAYSLSSAYCTSFSHSFFFSFCPSVALSLTTSHNTRKVKKAALSRRRASVETSTNGNNFLLAYCLPYISSFSRFILTLVSLFLPLSHSFSFELYSLFSCIGIFHTPFHILFFPSLKASDAVL